MGDPENPPKKCDLIFEQSLTHVNWEPVIMVVLGRNKEFLYIREQAVALSLSVTKRVSILFGS